MIVADPFDWLEAQDLGFRLTKTESGWQAVGNRGGIIAKAKDVRECLMAAMAAAPVEKAEVVPND